MIPFTLGVLLGGLVGAGCMALCSAAAAADRQMKMK